MSLTRTELYKKYFIVGSDVSPEENLNTGYLCLFKDKYENLVLCLVHYDERNEEFKGQMERFSDFNELSEQYKDAWEVQNKVKFDHETMEWCTTPEGFIQDTLWRQDYMPLFDGTYHETFTNDYDELLAIITQLQTHTTFIEG